MAETGIAHKIMSVILRLSELSSAIIVLGILSRFCYLAGIAEAHVDGRIIYTIVVSCFGIIYSICFCPPFKVMFLGFPFDFVMFVMWLVAYCLLQTRTGSHTCSASWYYNYWGYYWGRFWRAGPVGTVNINAAGCASWRTALAFAFIAWFLHLLSGVLVGHCRVELSTTELTPQMQGIYVFRTYVKLDETKTDIKQHAEKLAKGDPKVHGYQRNVEATDNV
ncbi:hypothetical protein F52700_3545 [Fusarium sp. NRRL 52700]|nr:hypothetical protein F52700_3545 [Fusarium sp. NRRL 52700]